MKSISIMDILDVTIDCAIILKLYSTFVEFGVDDAAYILNMIFTDFFPLWSVLY